MTTIKNIEVAAVEQIDELQHGPSALARILPNAITASALCAGLVSVHLSVEGRYDMALGAIIVSAILDGLDGRVARKLGSCSRFGAEFDSLADFLSFGIAPIVLLYCWSGDYMTVAVGLCFMTFALGSALRLARFNSNLDEPAAPWRRAYFSGMPTPSAALAVLLPISLIDPSPATMNLIGLYAAFIAVLMVSNIPTFSGKKLGFGGRGKKRLVLETIALLVIVLFAIYPREIMVIALFGYLASIPVSWYRFHASLKREDALQMR